MPLGILILLLMDDECMCSDKFDKNVKIDIVIPAYDSNHQGLAISLKLMAESSTSLTIRANGTIAKSLEKSFTRVIHIMTSLKRSWRCLENYQYTLDSNHQNFNVRDARSADFSLCIAALNNIRNHYNKNSITHYVGTGSLRVDGSFNATFLEELKELAINKMDINKKKFINTKSCNHIFDLEALLEDY